MRGLQYEREKAKQGGTGANQFKSRPTVPIGLQTTSARLAKQHKVSESTIFTDAKFVN